VAPAAGLPAGPPGDGPVRVDMLVNGQILVAGGGTVAWPAGTGARPWFGYRVPAGWLVESMPAPEQGVDTISLVDGGGRLRASLTGSGLRVSPDGLLAAWVSASGDTIVAGHVGGAVTGAGLAWEDADTFVLATPAFGADSTRLSAIRCRLGSGTGVLVRDARLPATTEAAITLPDPAHAGPAIGKVRHVGDRCGTAPRRARGNRAGTTLYPAQEASARIPAARRGGRDGAGRRGRARAVEPVHRRRPVAPARAGQRWPRSSCGSRSWAS
jgi:hypothetical protein